MIYKYQERQRQESDLGGREFILKVLFVLFCLVIIGYFAWFIIGNYYWVGLSIQKINF